MMKHTWNLLRGLMLLVFIYLSFSPLYAQEAHPKKDETKSLDVLVDQAFEPISKAVNQLVFINLHESSEKNAEGKPKWTIPFILAWLAGGAFLLTIYFKFINIRSMGLAFRTVSGKYSKASDPGEITHFQALAAAVSGTVGLGNIAGVAIAINLGGPGACFWMLMLGLCGMTSKFAECTLGVKYRKIDAHGVVHGGAMMYLTRGLADRGLGSLGKALAVVFAIFCVGGAFGGGNMYQINQAASQLVHVTGGPESFLGSNRWLIGLVVAILVGLVLIGGISRIAKVTDKLVPTMTLLYVVGCLAVIGSHIDQLLPSIQLILKEAFNGNAAFGGVIGAMMMGFRRAAFSNEAGLGSAPIAHAAAKTRFAASEGIVALLEPFVDTVIICTMTALVVITTGVYKETGRDGITLTSESFATVAPWFEYALSVAVILFALSTLITWSYYGLQAWKFIFGKSSWVALSYKIIFCGFIVLGAAVAPGNVIDFSDAMMLAMCFPNLIGVFLLLPVIKKELMKFQLFTQKVDAGQSLDEAHDEVVSTHGA